jgi:hypothetical protein
MNNNIYLLPEFNIPVYQLYDLVTVDLSIKSHAVELLKTNPKIIVDLAFDGWTALEVNAVFENIGATNIIILSGTDNNLTSNSIFFPAWMYSKSLLYSKNKITTIKKYHISCLNRFPKQHRLYTYSKLVKKNYNSLLSCWHPNIDPNTKQPINLNLNDDVKNEVGDLTNFFKEVDIGWNENDHGFLHPAFTDSYLNIVTESSTGVTFFTEKTCKPLVAGQLFLQVNGKNGINKLQQLGIECFDFDEYDNDNYFIDRIDKMLNFLDKIYNDLPDIYNENLPKIKYNQEYLLSQTFRNRLLAPLLEHGLLKNI